MASNSLQDLSLSRTKCAPRPRLTCKCLPWVITLPFSLRCLKRHSLNLIFLTFLHNLSSWTNKVNDTYVLAIQLLNSFIFWDFHFLRVLLCSSGWAQTHSDDYPSPVFCTVELPFQTFFLFCELNWSSHLLYLISICIKLRLEVCEFGRPHNILDHFWTGVSISSSLNEGLFLVTQYSFFMQAAPYLECKLMLKNLLIFSINNNCHPCILVLINNQLVWMVSKCLRTYFTYTSYILKKAHVELLVHQVFP